MIGRVVLTSVGYTHASSVNALETAASVADIGTCTLLSDAPSNDTPFPKYPALRATGPISVPVLPFPVPSAVGVPLLSLNPNAAAGPLDCATVLVNEPPKASASPVKPRTNRRAWRDRVNRRIRTSCERDAIRKRGYCVERPSGGNDEGLSLNHITCR